MISVFTPVHLRVEPFLTDAYNCLLRQTNQDWEWLIGFNAGANILPAGAENDTRVRTIFLTDDTDPPHNKIGRLKGELCALAKGDILFEYDADDLLSDDALEECAKAFQDPIVQFAYSNDAQFDANWGIGELFGTQYGWRHRPVQYDGHDLIEHVSFLPSAHSLRMVDWAPDHFRAWRTSGYRHIGGHDRSMISGDDHDLMVRTYLVFGEKAMRHIDKCLYLYRLGDNTFRVFNSYVRDQVGKNYVRYIYQLAQRWAADRNLPCYDLGGGINPHNGFLSVDLEGADLTADLNKPWPFGTDSVGVLRASHLIEHLDNICHFFNEAYRVLAPGGWLLLEYPSSDGKGSFRDPTHKHHINEQTIWYFTRTEKAKFIRFKGRFQESRIHVYDMEPGVPVVAAELIALKPPYTDRPPGAVLI